MPSGLTATPSGAFSLAANGGAAAVESADVSAALTARRIASGGSYADKTLSTGSTSLKARNNCNIASLTGTSLALISPNGIVSAKKFQTYAAVSMPIILGASGNYAQAARMANPQKEGTLELTRVQLNSGALRTVDFPVEVVVGWR